MSRARRPLVLGCCWLLVGACAGDETGERSRPPDPETVASLVIRSEVRIGGDAAEGPAALGSIGRARLLDDPTRVAVPASMAREIHVFSAEGEYLETLGGQGEGPGEYELVTSVFGLPGGGIVGWDRPRRTVNVHGASADETLLLDLPPLPDRAPRFLGVFADTTFAFGFPLAAGELRGRPGGRLTDTVPFLRVDRRGAVIDTMAFVTAPGRTLFDVGPLWGLEADIFGDEPRAAVAGDELAVALGRDVTYYPRSGPPRRHEVPWEPRIATPEMVGAERERRIRDLSTARVRLSSGEDLGQMHGEVIEGLPAADTVPAFDDLAAGHDGSVWVRRFAMPGDTVADWFLVDPEAGIRASLRLPVAERLESGSAVRAVVRSRDPLGSVVLRVLELGRAP